MVDSSRRLILFVLALVLAKTIDPSLPLTCKYYVYILTWQLRKLYITILTCKAFQSVNWKKAPILVLRTLAERLNPERRGKQHSRLPAFFMSIFGGGGSGSGGKRSTNSIDDDESIVSLVSEIFRQVNARMVAGLPMAIHTATDRAIFVYERLLCPAFKAYQQVPFHDYILTVMLTAGAGFAYRRMVKRVRNAAEVPLEWYTKQKRLSGWCVAVTDSDNIRFHHAPTFLHRLPRVDAKARRLETINVRLSGIDAPEMGHFGGTAQPYAKEAKEWLTQTVCNRRVVVTMHRLDQYNRVIGSVNYFPDGLFWSCLSTLTLPFLNWAPRSLSLEMVRAGYAVLYESAGAEYGGLRAKLEAAERDAKHKKIGMWQNADPVVHPAEYKKMRLLSSALQGLETMELQNRKKEVKA